jgi:hypothetical protein
MHACARMLVCRACELRVCMSLAALVMIVLMLKLVGFMLVGGFSIEDVHLTCRFNLAHSMWDSSTTCYARTDFAVPQSALLW